MSKKCPNISHPDWKALVKKHGENGAIKKYLENGEVIPSLDGSTVSNSDKISIRKVFGTVGDLFTQKSTLDTIDKHPEVLSKIIDNLQKAYPWIKLNKESLFDENGNEVFIKPGKVGMHYRSAIVSAIAYANGSYMETIPHEYAHEYIDMYRNTDIVRDAIKKYGEERLVTLIGRKYAGQQMSNSFEKFLEKLWKLIRNTFGSPSVIDTLTDSFAKNEALGTPLSRGTAIYNYQDTAPLLNRGSIIDFNDEIKKFSKENKVLTDKEVETKIQDDFAKENIFDDEASMLSKFELWWGRTAGMIKGLKDGKGDSKNYAAIDESLVKFVNSVLTGNNEARLKILSKIKGDEVELSPQEAMVYKDILNLQRAIMHKERMQKAYLQDDKYIESENVNKQLDSELSTTFEKRKENLKSKNKYLRWAAESLSKGLKYVANSRLWAKYVSGSENSLFSNVVYKGLNNGREGFSEYYNTFKDFFNSKTPLLIKGSTFHNKNASIDELDTKTIELDANLNPEIKNKKLQLTKAELLSIYLTNRQVDGRNKLIGKGFTLLPIKDRNLNLSNNYRLTESQIDDIVSELNNDKEVQTLVQEIDNAMKYSHQKLNEVHTKLEGYEMEKIENYFPISHGVYKGDVSKSKNVIEDMRSFRKRFDESGSVRLDDPFSVLSRMQLSNSTYVGYAIPIHNAQLAIDAVRNEYSMADTNSYIMELQGTINKVQDAGLLYSTQGEQEVSKIMNKVASNFGVALLAKNLSVVFKQQVSLETAALEINRKYIRKSGASLGVINFVNPIDLLRRLSFKGTETKMPIEWTQITNNENYKELVSKSALMRDRFGGMTSRETGEAVMGAAIGEDRIKVPFMKEKDGSPVYITKSRLMMGITIMDTLTILRLYDAVKLETQDRIGEPMFAKLSAEEITMHNINRLQEIIDKTQPTFDQINRTGLSRNSNPVIRAATMFSSATSKMSMLLIDSIVDYNNNPTSENLKKLGGRAMNLGVTTTIQLAMIDMIWYGLRAGWDDDDWETLPEKLMIGSAMNSIGTIQGVGTVMGVVISQMDSNPWYQTIQDPFTHVIQEGAESLSNLGKGNLLKATKGITNTVFKYNGLPVTPGNNALKVIDRFTE